MAYKSCWIITDHGKVGTENQCVGLANALGLTYTLKRITAKWPWSFLPPSLWIHPLTCIREEIAPPWPSLIIGAGRVSAAPVAYVRQASQGRTKVIQLLNPYLPPRKFDLVIAPEHDQLEGETVIQTVGALNKVTPDALIQGTQQFSPLFKKLPKPLVAVLIGGSNKSYTLDESIIETLIAQLKTLIEIEGIGVAITLSRRTDLSIARKIQKAFEKTSVFIWKGEGPNPYFGLLAEADFILVTEDSVSMTSEACFTGKPVYVVPLKGQSPKFSRFHHSLQEKGHTRPFDGKLEMWSAPPLQETQRVAQVVKERLKI